ncbi:MAG: UDP-N-acetylmuramoyl-L-alanyl-D-glutamate--2,6-diaminopimelate ligase [Desulfobacterales bacterium]|nr:UDP-N-acetylmuramoyl-L-alanyl-D-glutamate--2,6-diaminopimelate ligase [Desulfobacterales bacterium]MBF0396046.1 UDP-N-acetylmuramoyl-L-alanyl-D-glutamate--2,6-diaminopimelate ligase [Desulfobacterales bacterium]
MNILNLLDISSDLDITSIHYRAQEVKEGGLFVAIPGVNADGHDFIQTAIEKGAAAIVCEREVDTGNTLRIMVQNSRNALAAISSKFYNNPTEKLVLIGVTGTNGKTTTTYLIESILKKANFSVGVIGTINYRYLNKTFNNPNTTPESLDLMRILSEMVACGVTHVVMEVSSHAIELSRIDSCLFDVSVFTNLTLDHLDFHQTMESYWQCKQRLFTEHLFKGQKKDLAKGVINCSNDKGKELKEKLNKYFIISVGEHKSNTIWVYDVKYSLTGITGMISKNGTSFEFRSNLCGKYNLENILCAVGVSESLNISADIISSGIESLEYVPGRLQRIPNDMNRFVYVDYAHTPDALQNVLKTLRDLTEGRIICIFGCGGDRDRSKRPKMAEIAASISDFVVVTSDNPRNEDPKKIIDEILSGLKTEHYIVEVDRRKAIEKAITISKEGDTVLIAGKGHEDYQIVGTVKAPFDDMKEAELALERLKD